MHVGVLTWVYSRRYLLPLGVLPPERGHAERVREEYLLPALRVDLPRRYPPYHSPQVPQSPPQHPPLQQLLHKPPLALYRTRFCWLGPILGTHNASTNGWFRGEVRTEERKKEGPFSSVNLFLI